jgi:hypothetical protein
VHHGEVGREDHGCQENTANEGRGNALHVGHGTPLHRRAGPYPRVLSEIACLQQLLARHRITPQPGDAKGEQLLNLKRVTVAIIIAVFLQLSLGHGQAGNSAQQTVPPSTLVLNTITPAAGTLLSKETVIIANLSYDVKDFENGRYTILAQFETKKGKITTDGDFPNEDYPELTQATGQLNFSFPMKHIWRHKEVKRPFVMWFYLMKWKDRSSGTRVAMVGPVEFQAQ